MKYESVDWSEWPSPPSKENYDRWAKNRKLKHRINLDQGVINKYGKHVTRAVNEGIWTVDDIVFTAGERAWRAILYNYIYSARQADFESHYAPEKPIRGQNLEQQLNDVSWAHGLEYKYHGKN